MTLLPTVNSQPSEGPAPVREDGGLDVHSIWMTLQGEGPLSGEPAVFVRLAGCSLKCPSCDTLYTSPRRMMTPKEIIDRVRELWPIQGRFPLIVLTGGEPFRQSCVKFVEEAAHDQGMRVQVETNGIHDPGGQVWWRSGVSVVVSPKTGFVHPVIQDVALAWKYVLTDGCIDPDDGLPTSVLGMPGRPCRPTTNARVMGRVWVQPADLQDPVRNQANLKACVEVCMKFGYRLCVQMHKLCEVP